MERKRIMTVKIGGKIAESDEMIGHLAEEMCRLSDAYWFTIIHGGGAEVTALSRRLGMEPLFRDGIRMTSPAEMDIADMVLCGKLNKKLVRLFRTCGLDAVGLSGSDGGVFTAQAMTGNNGEKTRTGEVCEVNPRLLMLLLQEDYLPVIASTSIDAQGLALNVNADSVAFSLASNLGSYGLVFLSDIAGIIKNGVLLRDLSADEAKQEIQTGTITGGMIPKVESSLRAINNGVQSIIIGTYEYKGNLKDLLSGKQGTHVHSCLDLRRKT